MTNEPASVQHCIGVHFVVKAVADAAAICDGRVWCGVLRVWTVTVPLS